MTETRKDGQAHKAHAKTVGIRCSRATRQESGPCVNCGYRPRPLHSPAPIPKECEICGADLAGEKRNPYTGGSLKHDPDCPWHETPEEN